MYDARNNDSYFNHFLEWVPFERLANVEQIGEGGYFKVYSAVWVDGKSTCINKPIDKSFRRVSNLKPLMKVVLKKLKVSHNGMPDLFLNKKYNNRLSNELKKSKSMCISRSMSNEVSFERKPNPLYISRRSKSSEALYEKKPISMYISRPSIDSINEDESVISYDSNRPSIESDETTYDRNIISMYINRQSISANDEEVSYVRNIDSLYINRLSANKDEISYESSLINRTPTIKSIHSIDEIDESNSDSTYINNLPSTYPSTYNDFSKTKTNSFSRISYLKDNEE
ncbi:8835_t:CDS:2, partial [Rhizophagus irregularis]